MRPDALLVLGDTNSCIAALMARRMQVPVYHMEAGNRCFDLNVPEETNRRLVDHVADFNLVYTEHARRNLLAEGLHPRRIMLTGSPMREVLEHYRPAIDASTVLARLGPRAAGGYFLVSAHREENVDDPARLGRLLDCLRAVRDTWDCRCSSPPIRAPASGWRPRSAAPVVGRASPSTSRSASSTTSTCSSTPGARCRTAARSREESAILGFPAVTLRDSIERPEALDAGSIMMTGLDPGGVVEAVTHSIAAAAAGLGACPADYDVGDTSARVVSFILSTVRRHHDWSAIQRRPAAGKPVG